MARYTPGIAGTLQGSIGNLTFSRNRFGPYVRTRAIPVNPNTPQQQLVKAFMTALSTAWLSTLSQLQRNSWDLYAANVPRPQDGGGSIFLTGHEMFIRSNVSRGQQNLLPVLDGPTLFDIGTYTAPAAALVVPALSVSITFTETDDWVSEDGAGLMVWGGRPQSVGVNFFKGPYQVAGTVLGNLALPPTSPAVLTFPFQVSAGQRAYFRANVTRADGRLSEPVALEATVV